MAFTEGTNNAPRTADDVKFGGIADAVLTSAGLWIPRSYAAGDAVDGKYVQGAGLYGWNEAGSVAQRIRSGKGGALGLTGVLNTVIALYDSATTQFRTPQTLNNIGDANQGFNGMMLGASDYNGTTYDRRRNNMLETVLASAARTAAVATGALTNYNGRGVQVDVNVTVKAGATTFTVQLVNQGNQVVSSVAAVAIAAGTTSTVQFGPGVVAADLAAPGYGRAVLVGRTYKIQIVPSDASSVTYSVDVHTLN